MRECKTVRTEGLVSIRLPVPISAVSPAFTHRRAVAHATVGLLSFMLHTRPAAHQISE